MADAHPQELAPGDVGYTDSEQFTFTAAFSGYFGRRGGFGGRRSGESRARCSTLVIPIE